MPKFVEHKIYTNLPLQEGQEAYEGWKNPPVTPQSNVYVFNLTNEKAFLNGDEKPNYAEVGPFVYQQIMNKTNIEFSQDGDEITHSVYREFYFTRSLSVSSDDTYVIVPNIPLFGLIKKLSNSDSYTKSAARSLLEGYKDVGIDTKPFIKVTVKELLWGYPSVMLSMKRRTDTETDPSVTCKEDLEDYFTMFDNSESDESEEKVEKINCDILPGNLMPFGLFKERNGTSNTLRTVKTGKSDPFTKGTMVAWDGSKTFNYWSTNQCNQVSGNSPGSLPLRINENEKMKLFFGPICRPLHFKFDKKVTIDSYFQTMRFIPEEKSFSSPDEVPENQCYCLQEPCLPSGLLDISGCKEGSPVYMSWPHFLHGDPQLRKNLIGMAPDEEKHSFIMDVLPKYGIALRAFARLQMNVVVEKSDGFGWFDKINQEKIYLPALWFEEGIGGPSEIVSEKVKFLLELPEKVANLQTAGLFVMGLLLLIPEIILWSKSCLADLR